jgi:uncharacterized membrane protein YedE/YeeE
MSDLSLGARPLLASTPVRALTLALIVFAAGLIYLDQTVSNRQAALWVVGTLLGVVLYHASFGFTSAWRVFIADRRGAGLRAQMLMLALGVLLFFPPLASGTLFGHAVTGYVFPVGISVAVGSLIFGIGMQLGGGCASGTLFAVGGGSTRMIVTLVFFIVGSLLGTAQLPWWAAQPAFKPYSIIHGLGLGPAIAVNLALFAVIAGLTIVLEKRRHGQLAPDARPAHGTRSRWLIGPWPMWTGAIALAILNFATLALAGRPWGITSAFALWGAKTATALGVDVASWPYWQPQAKALAAPLSFDITTVMDIGIMLGAFAASILAGRFDPVWRIPMRSLAGCVLGGLLLGYGARISFGCNIGSYFSGIVSGSLHGWLWLACAFIGNIIGAGLRPIFGLTVEKTIKQSAC